MSRTYRRKRDPLPWWIAKECVRPCDDVFAYFWIERDQTTVEFKKELSRYHSDAGTTNFKEPGPHWFRNLTTDRPARRFEKEELRKFMLNPEYEPMILPSEPLDYWT